ncbi:MAG: N-6 DNA methylase, partial [Bacteroidaceae bacterium]|nr:N-6 DNA methylase [Bacteroidaceae bacterium]
VWFYDMKADGFSLDDKRNPVADNDIADIIARFHNLEAEASRTRKEQSFLVPVEEIREKGYDLSINKYKEIEREKVVYEASDVIFGRITSLEEEILSAMEEFKGMMGNE